MKTFDEWIDEYMPNRLYDSHATFTLNDMREAFDGGQENSYVAEHLQQLLTEEVESNMTDTIKYENKIESLERKNKIHDGQVQGG